MTGPGLRVSWHIDEDDGHFYCEVNAYAPGDDYASYSFSVHVEKHRTWYYQGWLKEPEPDRGHPLLGPTNVVMQLVLDCSFSEL